MYFTKPSVILNYCVKHARDFWSWLGKWVAVLSSYLTYIYEELDEILKSAYEVFLPLFNLLMSWLYFFKGYYDVFITYANPYLIPIGTILGILIVLYIVYKYNLHNRFMKYCTKKYCSTYLFRIVIVLILLSFFL
jgi:hypothetical protein